MFTKESISIELKRIQDSVPTLLKQNTLIEVKKTPIAEFVLQKTLEEAELTDEKRKQLENLLAGGKFSKSTIRENPKVAKMRDDYVQRQIRKAVREGRLPNKKQLQELGLNKLHD